MGEEVTKAVEEAATSTSAETAVAVNTDINVETKEEITSSLLGVDGSADREGGKRKLDDGEKVKEEKIEATPITLATTESGTVAAREGSSKKAKIAMPPSVSSNLTDVEKYTLESPPPVDNTNEKDAETKIMTPNLMLFNLHPLIRELPLTKLLEEYGIVNAVTVRTAFASRYGHVSFNTVEEARKCYTGIHGAKLLHKKFLVQPSIASATTTATKTATTTTEDSAGAAAAAAVAATTCTTTPTKTATSK
mmetsp:Transcript_13121/g.12940  ORF Transcript_13121/g.12940 Transcript_13121/m.12940 type:complete len:250 (+) Transcript_13121:73-822(+)